MVTDSWCQLLCCDLEPFYELTETLLCILLKPHYHTMPIISTDLSHPSMNNKVLLSPHLDLPSHHYPLTSESGLTSVSLVSPTFSRDICTFALVFVGIANANEISQLSVFFMVSKIPYQVPQGITNKIHLANVAPHCSFSNKCSSWRLLLKRSHN